MVGTAKNGEVVRGKTLLFSKVENSNIILIKIMKKINIPESISITNQS